jgi:hypothetical protein
MVDDLPRPAGWAFMEALPSFVGLHMTIIIVEVPRIIVSALSRSFCL